MTKKLFLPIALFFTLFLSGCVSASGDISEDFILEHGGSYSEQLENSNQDYESKILSVHEFTGETLEMNDSIKKIENKLYSLSGYIYSHNVNSNKEKELKESNIIIKVPSENKNSFVSFLNETIQVTSEKSESIDITKEYYEKKLKIEHIEEQEKELKKIYNNVSELEDLFTVNEKINDISDKKNELKKDIIHNENQLSYSTIEIKLDEVNEYTIETGTFNEKFKSNMKSSIQKVYETIGIIILFIVKLIPLILLFIIGGYVYKRYLKEKIKSFIKKEKEYLEKSKEEQK